MTLARKFVMICTIFSYIFMCIAIVLVRKSSYSQHRVPSTDVAVRLTHARAPITKTSRRSSWNIEVSHDKEQLERRLITLNEEVERTRKQIIAYRDRSESARTGEKFPNISRFVVLQDIDPNVHAQLAQHKSVSSVILRWIVREVGGAFVWNSLTDTSNLLVQSYYAVTADAPLLCQNYTTRKHNCSFIPGKLLQRNSLEPEYLSWKKSSIGNNASISFFGIPYVATHLSLQRLLIFQDAMITPAGDIFSETFKYVPSSRRPDYSDEIPVKWLGASVYPEVFVLTQFDGYETSHGMIHVMPRVALFINFLKKNPHIKILVLPANQRFHQLLAILGIKGSRLLGGVVRANIAYVPPTAVHAMPRPQQTQLLSRRYHEYIKENFPTESKLRLILIRGLRHRKFKQHKAIEKVIKSAAKDFHLEYTLFDDSLNLSLNDTMTKFYSAVMVVAPHGAGLSNVIFTPPDIFIVEGLCAPPVSTFCYRDLAHILGHHWHGIRATRCETAGVDVDELLVDIAVRKHLQVWQANGHQGYL